MPSAVDFTIDALLAAVAFAFAFSRKALLTILGIAATTVLAWSISTILIVAFGTLTDTLTPTIAVVAAGVLGLVASQSPLYREDHRKSGASEDATVLFVDVRGSTQLLVRLGVDTYRVTVEKLMAETARIISHHDGQIERTQGDGCLILFRPRPVRHHALRCADCIEELLDATRKIAADHQIELQICLGFESGIVTGGFVTEAGHRVWSSAGATVNLAQRLQSASGDLGIDVVIGPVARRLIEFEYPTRSLGTFVAKGFDGTIEAATFEKETRKV
jgi:class 3 adenylate cyclase